MLRKFGSVLGKGKASNDRKITRDLYDHGKCGTLPAECKDLLFEIKIYPDEAEKYFAPLLCVLYSRLKGKGYAGMEKDILVLLKKERQEKIALAREKHNKKMEDEVAGKLLEEMVVEEQPSTPNKKSDSKTDKKKDSKSKSVKKEARRKKAHVQQTLLDGSNEGLTTMANVASAWDETKEQKEFRKRLKQENHKKAEALIQKIDPDTIYTGKEKIGKGGFGDVYIAKNRITGERVAIKVMRSKFEEAVANISNEIVMLHECQHKNIVKFIACYYWEEQVHVVMEYCDGGTLLKLIEVKRLSEEQLAFIIKQVLQALDFLHKQNRVHRDIKCANILMNLDGRTTLADLGLCAQLTEGGKEAAVAGSVLWMAPEMIKFMMYDCKADIFSLGATLIEMIEGNPPYHYYHPIKAMFRIATRGMPELSKPEKCSPEMLDFLKQSMQKYPAKRPSAATLLNHPFLAKACKPKDIDDVLESVFLTKTMREAGF